MHIMRLVAITLVMAYTIPLALSCQSNAKKEALHVSPEGGWKVVYKHDALGNPLSGSIDSLIAGIRNGYELKIGWGWEKKVGDDFVQLEHRAQPIFLSIIQNKSVSVVIDGHPLLASYIDPELQKFAEGGHIWQGVLTTSGTFNAQVYQRSTGNLLKDWPQRHNITWFMEFPNSKPDQNDPFYISS